MLLQNLCCGKNKGGLGIRKFEGFGTMLLWENFHGTYVTYLSVYWFDRCMVCILKGKIGCALTLHPQLDGIFKRYAKSEMY